MRFSWPTLYLSLPLVIKAGLTSEGILDINNHPSDSFDDEFLPSKNFCPHMARKVVRMPLPRLDRALNDVRIKNAAVAPITIVVDRRSERFPS
jgi:hypothetical protein